MSKQILAQIKIVEVGEIKVAQQNLPGMDKAVDAIPFEREYFKGNASLEMTVDGAMAMVGHIFKRKKKGKVVQIAEA